MQASGDAVGNVSSRVRWTLSEAVDASPLSASQLACARHGGFCSGADRFANTVFRVSPAEAEVMDPQQRMLLEAGYAGLHSAGQRRSTLMGGDGGVFVGIERPDWALLQALRRSSSQGAPPSAFAVTADTVNVASGRLSFVLGLQGPCSSVDTACSSALAALHAGSSAAGGVECGVAVVLAVSLKLMPQPTLGAAAAVHAVFRRPLQDARLAGKRVCALGGSRGIVILSSVADGGAAQGGLDCSEAGWAEREPDGAKWLGAANVADARNEPRRDGGRRRGLHRDARHRYGSWRPDGGWCSCCGDGRRGGASIDWRCQGQCWSF